MLSIGGPTGRQLGESTLQRGDNSNTSAAGCTGLWGIEMEGLALTRGGGDKPSTVMDTPLETAEKEEKRGSPQPKRRKKTEVCLLSLCRCFFLTMDQPTIILAMTFQTSEQPQTRVTEEDASVASMTWAI